jgi:hypothetical protein
LAKTHAGARVCKGNAFDGFPVEAERERKRERGPAQRAKEEEGWGSGSAHEAGGRPTHGAVEEGGGLAADNGRAPVGRTREVALGESSQWAVAGPLIWGGLMNSSFFDLIQIILTKPD